MTDLTKRLAEALDVCNAATAGPWEAEYSRDQGNCVIPHDAKSTLEAVAVTRLYYQQFDAEFIATARTGYPAALKALQAVLAIETEPISGSLMGYEIDQAEGWNEAVRHVRAVITKHLGAAP